MKGAPSARTCLFFFVAVCLAPFLFAPTSHTQDRKENPQILPLPEPRRSGALSLEDCLASRRTRRLYAQGPLSFEEIAQLLWAAQGITEPKHGLRTAPSAGALYPLEVYLVAGEGGVEGLEAGLYGYLPGRHAIEKIRSGDLRQSLAAACLGQAWMAQAPTMFLLTAEYARTERKYGTRGQRYAWMEAGHVCQNLLLEVEALGLAAAVVGAFDDRRLSETVGLPAARQPLAVVTVGRKK
mgnify:CR=1 FL=1